VPGEVDPSRAALLVWDITAEVGDVLGEGVSSSTSVQAGSRVSM